MKNNILSKVEKSAGKIHFLSDTKELTNQAGLIPDFPDRKPIFCELMP
jgi:hypothetical protein